MMGGMAVGLGAGVADITAHALDPIRQEQSMSSAVPSGGISSPPEELGIKEKSAPVSPPSPNADFKTTLDNLMMMKDVGALTDEEFDSAKVDLMKKFGLR
ncbi:MAG: hypothetical protein FWD65_04460 [Coriobacteriia bacterium]|nr:hypothetical protein [Coriobacteriia bacterium]